MRKNIKGATKEKLNFEKNKKWKRNKNGREIIGGEPMEYFREEHRYTDLKDDTDIKNRIVEMNGIEDSIELSIQVIERSEMDKDESRLSYDLIQMKEYLREYFYTAFFFEKRLMENEEYLAFLQITSEDKFWKNFIHEVTEGLRTIFLRSRFIINHVLDNPKIAGLIQEEEGIVGQRDRVNTALKTSGNSVIPGTPEYDEYVLGGWDEPGVVYIGKLLEVTEELFRIYRKNISNKELEYSNEQNMEIILSNIRTFHENLELLHT